MTVPVDEYRLPSPIPSAPVRQCVPLNALKEFLEPGSVLFGYQGASLKLCGYHNIDIRLMSTIFDQNNHKKLSSIPQPCYNVVK